MKDIVELGDVPLKLFEHKEAKCPLGKLISIFIE